MGRGTLCIFISGASVCMYILRINILHTLITKNYRAFFYSQKWENVWWKIVWSTRVQKWSVLATNTGVCVRQDVRLCVRVSMECSCCCC